MWHLALFRWIGPRAQAMALLGDHLAWNRRQHGAGRLLFSGPSADMELGIMAFGEAAGDTETVRELCASEPFVAAGHRSVELVAWDVHQALGLGPFTVEELRAAGFAVPPAAG